MSKLAPSRINPHRRLGLTRAGHQGHLLSTFQEPQKSPPVKRRDFSPPTDAEPLSTSDEEPLPSDFSSDSDLGISGHKRKRGVEEISSSGVTTQTTGESRDRADIPSTKWTQREGTVQKSSQLDEAEALTYLDPPKPRWQYSKSKGAMQTANLHTKPIAPRKKNQARRTASASAQPAKDEFQMPDTIVPRKQRDKFKHSQDTDQPQTSPNGNKRAKSKHGTKEDAPKFKKPSIGTDLDRRFSARLREESFTAPASIPPIPKRSMSSTIPAFIAPSPLKKPGLFTTTTFKKPYRDISNAQPPADLFRKPELPTSSQIDDASSPSSSLTTPLSSPNLSTSSRTISFPGSSATIPKDTPPEPVCPVCATPVPTSLLHDFILTHSSAPADSRLTVRQQSLFCRTHKMETAQDTWRARGYPTIDWDELPARLEKHQDVISHIIKGQESFYRNVYEDKVRKGTGRTLVQSLAMGEEAGSETGYYGSRGAKVMMNHIITAFSRPLRRLAQTDKLIVSGGGVSSYVQAVLVPELAVSLIVEDMAVDKESARRVLTESADLGELVNEEEEDEVVEREEGEEGAGDGEGEGEGEGEDSDRER